MNQILTIQKHCLRLCEFLHWNEINFPGFTRMDLLEWIEKASMIKEIILDDSLQSKQIKSIFPNAGEEEKRIFAQISKALLVFTFIYSAVEMLIESLNLSNIPKEIISNGSERSGKINKACYFIKTSLEDEEILEYNSLINKLRKLLGSAPYPLMDRNTEIVSYFDGLDFTSNLSIGLYVTYKIRNQFAHGAYIFQNFNGRYYSQSFTSRILNISSQILLLTIQMILMIREKKNTNLVITLKQLHLKK